MKLIKLALWLCALGVTCVFVSASAQDKSIKLRNERISTHALKETPADQGFPAFNRGQPAKKEILSGLFIIQLNQAIPDAWQGGLRNLGVELVRYVPEDAYIVRCTQVPLARLEALPFVRWVGEYRPEHKVHKALRKAFQEGADSLSVSVLLSPLATPDEKVQARRAFQDVHQESHLRQGAIFRGKIPKGQLDKLADSPTVLWIEPGPKMKLFDEVSSKIVAGDGGFHTTYTQMNGYDGDGVAVAVADSGLDTGESDTMHPDLFGRATNFFSYGRLTDASDGHGHGTHVAGIIAGDGAVGEVDESDALYGLGVAPKARIITQRLFDDVGNYEAPPSFGAMTRDALHAGADIGSNSWGDDTQGRYDTSAMEFDALVRDADDSQFGDQPYILEFSAGNAGPGQQTIGSPAVGKNVIATGASQNNRFDFFIYTDGQEYMADFSSRGPCEDGRIKPDVTAPGTWIASLQSSYATDENAWASISSYYMYMGGTSQAGPHASGAAAVFVQYYRETQGGRTPSPALVKAALVNSAVDMDNEAETAPIPNNDEGWGRIDLTELMGSETLVQFLDQSVRLTGSQTYTSRVMIASGQMPLKLTLAYTDVPGFPGAVLALVNDLDLEVIGPDGRRYHGNRMLDGESLVNPADYDSINNVECVYLNNPLAGEYTVLVRARRIVEDALQETPGIMDQDFALVTSGDLLAPSISLVVLDQRAYSAPSRIGLKLYDFDLAGRSSVTNLITSSTEFYGEPVILRATAVSGIFTGSIATITGPAILDGRLQVSHNDTITVTYEDMSPRMTRTASAPCDLVPPVINNVIARNRFGQTYIYWDTDEEADGIVRYGTNPQQLTGAVTNGSFHLSHVAALTNLTPGITYYFLVVASDLAGNTSTNNNNGELFSFVPVEASTVLLVDAYVDELFAVPPLTEYTDALDQLGVSYEVWDATLGDSPDASAMRPFPLVIWRVPEFLFVSTFTPSEQGALSSYLDGGGALLLASMENNSRLDGNGGSGFLSNVLHVAGYNEDSGVAGIVGAPNDLISSGINMSLNYTNYEDPFKEGWLEADVSDTIVPGPGAVAFLYHWGNNQPVGLRYPQTGVDAPGRLIYLSFPLDAIPMAGAAPNNRVSLLGNMLNFLVPGVNGQGTIALDRNAYTLPSLVTVEVADSDLKGQGQTAVRVFSSTVSSGLALNLMETSRRGVFRGTINLVNATNAPAAGQLRAGAGDTIWAEYYDVSVQKTNRVTAVVDTVPAAISDVTAWPEYVDATITWTTSEPADSMVQFGKSMLLDRIAYSPDFSDYHELLLTGLEPEQTYYYQVVSRDEAGNTRIDNNGGQFYTFTTLQPYYPPWSDNFSNLDANWTVFTGEDSEGGWSWGVPANGRETSAHSEPSAWGSNLNGDPVTFVQSFLISPPILLAGGNRASLQFWHSYDFMERSMFDISEGGVVMIITNQYSDPLTLGQFGMDEVSAGWEEATFDLTPYAGQLVYLVWYYELISFGWDDVYYRPGWLVDDVSVTVSNVPPGAIRITNNLWQARFDLSGPLNLSSRGTEVVITNAPPGYYTVVFHDVPFYTTPPPQMGMLASYGSLLLQGSYSFPDANNNGMSDAWEQQFFNAVSPTRTPTTDTDGDGQSDYAEFMAGTDPRQSASKFAVTNLRMLENGGARLEWASVRDRAYCVEASSNARDWVPVSDWMHALSSTSYFNLPAPARGAPYLFRVVVKP